MNTSLMLQRFVGVGAGRVSRLLMVMAVVAAVQCGFSAHAASTLYLWSAAAPNGGNWSVGSNWVGGNAPVSSTPGNQTVVYFAQGKSANADIPGLVVDLVQFGNSGNILTGSFGITGANQTININDGFGGNIISANIALSGASCLANVTTGTLTISGNLSGGVGFIVMGAGAVTLTGNNTFLGTTTVGYSGTSSPVVIPATPGTLNLNAAGINTTIPGNLTIGLMSGTAGSNASVVHLKTSTQIADTSTITINPDGLLDAAQFIDTVGNLVITDGNLTLTTGQLNVSGLTMTGGSISGAGGTISLSGALTATSGSATGASVGSKLALNSASRTFTVNGGSFQPELTCTGLIVDGSGASGVFKNGTGILYLNGNATNTFTGTFTIDKGTVRMNNNVGYSIPGALVIGNNSDPANSAIAQEVQSNDISAASAVTINQSGYFDLNHFTDTLGALAGSGSVNLASGGLSGDLSVGGLNSNTAFSGNIGGTGTFTKVGTGTLTLSGVQSYNGVTTVTGGTLALNSGNLNTTLVSSSVVVGTGSGAPNSAILQLQQNNQIANATGITVNSDGLLDFNGKSDVFGSLTVLGGNVTIGGGSLSPTGLLSMTAGAITAGALGSINLGGDITATSSASAGATITANILLNGSRTITVNSGVFGPELAINGILSDGTASSSVLKKGAGILALSGSNKNLYTGSFTVDKGTVTLNQTVGVTITGPLIIGNSTDPANSAILRELNIADVSNASTVTINPSGKYDLNGNSDSINALTGTGSVTLGAGALTVGIQNGTSQFDGTIAGTGQVLKGGSGTLTLNGNNSYSGQTSVAGGTLIVNGLQSSSNVAISAGATLGGTGLVGNVTSTGGRVAPGPVGGTGKLSTGNLSLDANSALILDLTSAAPGGFDSLAVTGTVSLGGAALTINPVTTLTGSAKMVIIDNDQADAVSGTFAGQAEGSNVTVGGLPLKLSYAGGSGNDVELTPLNVPPVFSSNAYAAPSPASIGETVTFTAGATDQNGDTTTYVWNFGDGSSASGASVTHAYAAAGQYSAIVTADDGHGGTATSSISLTINAPVVGTGPDSDGDGFSDAFEAAAGTSPNNPASTPTGAPASAPLTLPASKLAIKLNFKSSGADAIALSGTLPVAAGTKVSGQRVTVDVGGVPHSFVLSVKGQGSDGKNSFKLTVKAQKGVVAAQNAKYSMKIGGSFANTLAVLGLLNQNDKGSSHAIVVTIVFSTFIYQGTDKVTYKAKKGAAGAAK